jgi:peptide chain release factor 1
MTLDLEQLKKDHKTSYFALEYERLLNEEKKVNEMVKDDESLRDLAEEEIQNIKFQKEAIERQIEEMIKSEKEDEEFPNEIVLEVRAGAGGDEASLFAWELAHMYERFAEGKKWSWKILHESTSSANGYKEASFEVRGIQTTSL